MKVLLRLLISIFSVCQRTEAQECHTASLPQHLSITQTAAGNGEDTIWKALVVSSDESTAYIGGQNQNVITGDTGSQPANRALLAKFSLITNTYDWVQSINVVNSLQEPVVSSCGGLALNPTESKLASIYTSAEAELDELYLSVHDPATGSILLPVYKVVNSYQSKPYYQNQVVFDHNDCIWIVLSTYQREDGQYLTDTQMVLKISVGQSRMQIDERKYFPYGTLTSILYTQNQLFIGGAYAPISKDGWTLALYKTDLTTINLQELFFLYNNGGFYTSEKSYQTIFIMKEIGQTLFFATQNRKRGDYGKNTLSCKVDFIDTSYNQVGQTTCIKLNFGSNDEKQHINLNPKSQTEIWGLSTELHKNTNNYLWHIDYNTNKVSYYKFYYKHNLYAGYLSNSKPLLDLEPGVVGTLQISTAYVVGSTDKFQIQFDGADYNLNSVSAIITSLRAGDETCASPFVNSNFDTNPTVPTIQLYNNQNTFQPTQQSILDDPIKSLVEQMSFAYQLDPSQTDLNQICDSFEPVLATSPGSFTDKVLYIGSDSYPLLCEFNPPTVTAGCSTATFSYFINQQTLSENVVSIDSQNSKIRLQIGQQSTLQEGDYQINVQASVGQNIFIEQFTFMLKLRKGNFATSCSTTLPCTLSLDPNFEISVDTINSQEYIYGQEGGAIATDFSVSTHPDCKQNNIVYSLSISTTSAQVDTSFIKVDNSGLVNWQSLEQEDAEIYITVIGSITLELLSITKTASTQFLLSCKSQCSSTNVEVYGFSSQFQLKYRIGDPPLNQTLVFFDNLDNSCPPKWNYTMFNEQSGQELSYTSSPVSFDSYTRSLQIYAVQSQGEKVELRVDVTNGVGVLVGSVYYIVELTENTSPFFNPPLEGTVFVPCSTEWSYALPALIDNEDDATMLFYDGGQLNSIIILVQNSTGYFLEKNSTEIIQGDYLNKFIMADNRNATYEVEFTLSVDQCQIAESYTPEYNTSRDDKVVEEQNPVKNQIQQPKAILKSFSAYGKIILEWNLPMKISSTVKTNIRFLEESEQQQVNLKLLQQSSLDYIQPTELGFTYQFKWIDNQNSQVEILFDRPELVSSDSEAKDLIQVEFNGFQTEEGTKLPNQSTIKLEVPRQNSRNSLQITEEKASKIESVATNTARVVVTLAFIVKAAANQLLSAIKNLNVIVHMFILNLPYPQNSQRFFAALFPLISFDVLPAEDLVYNKYFDFDEEEQGEMNDQFALLGYENIFIVSNMSSLFLMMVAVPVYILGLVLFVRFCWCKKWKIASKARVNLSQVPNTLFAQIDQTYLIFIIMALINVYNYQVDTKLWRFNSIFSVVLLAIYAVFPFFLGLLYLIGIKQNENFDEYKRLNSNFLGKYGELIQEYDICRIGKTKTVAIMILQFINKAVFALSIFILIDYPIFQIFTIMTNIIIYIAIMLHTKPFTNTTSTLQMLFDQLSLLVTVYHLFCFTEWPSPLARSYMGNSIIYFICIQSGTLLLTTTLYQTFTFVRRLKLKLNRLKKRVAAKVQQPTKLEVFVEMPHIIEEESSQSYSTSSCTSWIPETSPEIAVELLQAQANDFSKELLMRQQISKIRQNSQLLLKHPSQKSLLTVKSLSSCNLSQIQRDVEEIAQNIDQLSKLQMRSSKIMKKPSLLQLVTSSLKMPVIEETREPKIKDKKRSFIRRQRQTGSRFNLQAYSNQDLQLATDEQQGQQSPEVMQELKVSPANIQESPYPRSTPYQQLDGSLSTPVFTESVSGSPRDEMDFKQLLQQKTDLETMLRRDFGEISETSEKSSRMVSSLHLNQQNSNHLKETQAVREGANKYSFRPLPLELSFRN